ncbi:hypothetical protein QYM36_004505, partial [Artemia franciscana]
NFLSYIIQRQKSTSSQFPQKCTTVNMRMRATLVLSLFVASALAAPKPDGHGHGHHHHHDHGASSSSAYSSVGSLPLATSYSGASQGQYSAPAPVAEAAPVYIPQQQSGGG